MFKDVKDEIENVRVVSDFSDEALQNGTTGPLVSKEYQEIFEHDGYGISEGGFIQKKFQGIKIYHRNKAELAEDDIELILKQNELNFLRYETHLGV